MQTVITRQKIPIKLWLDDLDPQAMEQAEHLAQLPWTVGHVAIMPDAHVGYGMPIGGVMATRDVIIPNAVGVDIGCGVCAMRTDLRSIEKKDLKKILSLVRKNVPLGFQHHKKPQSDALMPPVQGSLPIVEREYARARKQLGTLGGGNHFIEIQQGDDGLVWLMVHSGSRNLGHQVASFYNKEAVRLNKELNTPVPKSRQLAALPLDSRPGRSYLAEMEFCVQFALANRKQIMAQVQEAMTEILGAVEFGELINRSHNFAALEEHGGRHVLVHRKGATRAFAGEWGLIPGSQGTASYIVRGKGNPESFCSCSHGAGRRLGRKQAIRSLDLDREIKNLDRIGVIHAIRRKKDLDEAPSAYKNIDQVMALQSDLVEIIVRLRPLAVIKG
jgi:tRNA-splicing ligase RtcB